MIKNGSEKKTRTRKKTDTLSASSKTNSNHDTKTEVSQIIHFGEQFKCKTKAQKDLLNLIYEKEIVFGLGPSGVGKTYVSAACALDLVKSTSTPYTNIIVCKPIVEAGESLGYGPGTIREKIEPYIASILKSFDKLIGRPNRLILEASGILEVTALAFLRGESIDNTIFIMDEAQNMTRLQMKMLLTRIGDNSKLVILGDLDQSDRYENPKHSGLYHANKIHRHTEEIGFAEFNDEGDVVRNKLISKILKNYKDDEQRSTQNAERVVPKPVIIKKKKSFLRKILNYFKLKK